MRRESTARASHLLAWAGLLAVCAALFALSFQRWGHPVIDLGRDLWVPSQLLEGRVLYRDVVYNYGPVAPYLLAGIVALLGDSLVVFAGVGIASGLLCMGAVYAIGCELADWRAGFVSGLLFCAFSFFAHSTWGCNFVLPYAYAATFSMTFALASFALLLRHLQGRSGAALVGSLVLALLAVATKVEVGVAIVGVIVVAGWVHRLSLRILAGAGAAAALAGVAGFAAFSARAPGDYSLWGDNFGRFAGSGLADPFFLAVAGLDRPGAALITQVVLLMALAGAVFGANAAARLASASERGDAATLAVGVVGAAALLVLVPLAGDARILGASVLVGPVLIAWLLLRDRRDPLLLLALLVLLCAPRVLLQAHPVWYGFTLSIPAIPLAVVGLGARLSPRMQAPRATAAVLVAVALFAAGRHVATSMAHWRAQSALFDTGGGTMHDLPIGRAEAIGAFLDHAKSRRGTVDSLLVLPEGVSLNHWSGLGSPSGRYLFTPPEVPGPEVEADILGELRAEPPDWIVMNSRDLREFGVRRFGADYAPRVGTWIRKHYVRERVFGPHEWKLELWTQREPLPRSR